MARSFHDLRSAGRVLEVLAVLNRHATARVRDIAAETGLPAATVVRVLETLQALGYVGKLDRLGGYHATARVQDLSAGYHGLPVVLETVCARAEEITRQVHWPVSVAVLEGDAMVVRYSTIPRSPMAHRQSTINMRLNLLRRAHGRAWLAFCPAAERTHLEALLHETCGEAGDLQGQIAAMRVECARAARAGYARRDPLLDPQTTSLAVPVFHEGRLVATLGVTCFTRTLTDPGVLVAALRAAAEGISPPVRSASPE